MSTNISFQKLSFRNNYNYFDLLSALQKANRRCILYDILYAATEFDLTGYGNAFLERAIFIASEDSGIAEPLLVPYLVNKYYEWKAIIKENKIKQSNSFLIKEARFIIIECGIALALAKKSRVVDIVLHASEIWSKDFEYINIVSYPDKFFELLSEGNHNKLFPFILRSYKLYGDEYWKIINNFINNDNLLKYVIQGLECAYSIHHKKFPLFFLIQACLLLTIPIENNNFKQLYHYNYQPIKLNNINILSHNDILLYCEIFYDRNLKVNIMKDYVFDKHTYLGKSMGRDLKHFWTISSHVENLGYPELYKDIVLNSIFNNN